MPQVDTKERDGILIVHPVKAKDQGIEIPGIFAAPPPSKIGDRGHNREIGCRHDRMEAGCI